MSLGLHNKCFRFWNSADIDGIDLLVALQNCLAEFIINLPDFW